MFEPADGNPTSSAAVLLLTPHSLEELTVWPSEGAAIDAIGDELGRRLSVGPLRGVTTSGDAPDGNEDDDDDDDTITGPSSRAD